MAAFRVDPADELGNEKALLLKAEIDIEQGLQRLRNQQLLLSELQAAGYDSTQAVRLVQLFQQTLIEWERHRVLIEARVHYLERQFCPEMPRPR